MQQDVRRQAPSDPAAGGLAARGRGRGLPGGRLALGVALLLALVFRVAQAHGTSLWLDELHTWFHVSQPSFVRSLETLARDNHPPLSFLLSRWVTLLFGDSELALRSVSILGGLGCVAVAARLAAARERPAGSAAVLLAGPFLVALSTQHIVATAEARMYGLFSLLAACALLGAVRFACGEGRAARRGAWCMAGALLLAFHTHYHAVHVALLLVGTTLIVTPVARRRELLAPLVVAFLLALPWAWLGLREQLQHELAPGGAGSGVVALARALVQLFYLHASLSGAYQPAYGLFALVLFGLAGLGAFRGFAHGGDARRRAVLLASVGLGLPFWSAAVAALAPRAGFHWIYLTPSVVPLAVLIADGAAGASRPARLALGLALLHAALLAALHLPGVNREEHRAAVASIVAELQPGDAVVATDRQPALFPHGLGWRYYAPRLAPSDLPAPKLLPVKRDLTMEFPAALDDAPRAFFLGRSPSPDTPALRELRARFPHEDVTRFGTAVFVHRFTR